MKRAPETEKEYLRQLNRNIMAMLRNGLRLAQRNPAMALLLAESIFRQRKAAALRSKWEAAGVAVPPFMILSITHKCNLKCRGCYARLHQTADSGEMDEETLRRVVKEAAALGISIILIAGGEPLMRPEILDIAAQYPQVIFALFTNGLLIDESIIKKFKKIRNIVPIISLEGGRRETDGRRGEGIHDLLQVKIARLGKSGIFSGISFTLTGSNFALTTQRDFIEGLIKAGTKIFFFIEYVPVSAGTENLIVSEENRVELKKILEVFRAEFPAVFISFPGDEEALGGCLAAGRGFVHINPSGALEPCPFAPFSDCSVRDLPLKEALSSELLKKIRENQELLEEAAGSGGCTLWAKRDLVRSLLHTP